MRQPRQPGRLEENFWRHRVANLAERNLSAAVRIKGDADAAGPETGIHHRHLFKTTGFMLVTMVLQILYFLIDRASHRRRSGSFQLV